MNILQVIPYFSFMRGGDVNVCYNLTKQFTSMGHNVTILTTTFDYNKEDTDSIDNLTMVPVEYKFNLALFIYSPRMKKWLEDNIENYDIIHLHELRSYQNNIVTKYARRYNIPYIVMPHASTPKDVSKSFIKYLYDYVYGNSIMKNASHVIAVSNHEAKYDKLMTDKPVSTIYNGMNIEDFDCLDNLDSYRDVIGSPYILYFGRLDKLKGIDYLIKAFSMLPSKYDEYKLVIAGRINEYKDEVERIVGECGLTDRVVFTGFIDEEDKISIYHDADLFVNCVKYMGGVSLTVFEAILSDTPVIVSPQAGELIETMNAGTVIEYGDSNILKDAIIESLENKEKTTRQINNGQKYIRENLSWTKVSRDIIELYESIVSDNNG
ncbi:MAG: glycosyltransferase family 4 protein [Methanosphaera sp.]|nr:glycosyltransferase family 4 protein [Methanosphaera sp.]